jgi:hypothetical protein
MLLNIIGFILGIVAILLHVLVTVNDETEAFQLQIYKVLSTVYLILTVILMSKLGL